MVAAFLAVTASAGADAAALAGEQMREESAAASQAWQLQIEKAEYDAVWHAATTTVRDRKRLLRALIDEVQLRTEEKRHCVRIVWLAGRRGDGVRPAAGVATLPGPCSCARRKGRLQRPASR